MNVRKRLDLLVDKVFGLFYNSPVNKVPKPSNPVVLESATALAKKIQKRELTSEEIVCAFIHRIHEVNPIINAVVDQRFAAAIKEAQNIDKQLMRNNISQEEFATKPFLGVPFTAKETIAAQGLSNTFGLLSRKSQKATFDAKVIQQMKNAGAILLGVTNVPQLSAWFETRNPVYGVTNNPYDTSRTPGGSSGGEGSIVAACGSPIGIGSDLAGSIRNPAFMCGLFAHKPTSGLVSMNGVLFNTLDKKNFMATLGPLTKTSDDLIPVLKVLVDDSLLKLDDNVDVKRIKIFYVVDHKDPCVSPIRDEVTKTMLKIVDHFSGVLSEPPELLNIEELQYGGRIWQYWIKEEPNVSFATDLANREGQVSIKTELLKFCFRCSSFNISTILALIGSLFAEDNAQWAIETTNILQTKLTAALGTNGVLLYPSSPCLAGYHHTAVLRPFNANFFSIWNALKFCVTQVPLGLSEEGLPLGIQVVGAPFQDHLTIAVAKELERAFGGYVPP